VEFVEHVLLHKKRGVGGVPLEVLQEKRGVSLQLHVFLGAEFVELDVFGIVELERSWKNRSRAVPNTPLLSLFLVAEIRTCHRFGLLLVNFIHDDLLEY
jgi:hypothetical protein